MIHLKAEMLLRKVAEKLREMSRKDIERFIQGIVRAKRIFVHGAGRSGLVARAFAMRLMHLGFSVYVVGETTTPSIRKDDLLVIISGSGKTQSVCAIAKTAKGKKVRLAAITSYTDSPIGKLADIAVRIKGRVQEDDQRDYLTRQIIGLHEPITPLGTLFELTTMIFLDLVVSELMERQDKNEEHMKAYHTNLE